MDYEIMTKSWSKRRVQDKTEKIKSVFLADFLKQHDHFCYMHVEYENGNSEKLIARVIFNEIKQHWIVDGMKVAIRLI
ncbi:hypothetical protein [Aliikangiella maris]|uniref:Uncharacterized protein n=2 Tax=Aliikangiella maris TaxID=3162458 RepID=A0ABV2BTI2_9GAMM